jgi:SAM-dependent methyltransferase
MSKHFRLTGVCRLLINQKIKESRFMSQNSQQTDLTKHNLNQINYFERTVKQTMVPSDTPYNWRHVQETLKFAGYKQGDRVIEVGCGMGRHTLLLAQMGVQVEGLDLSQVLLDRLEEYSEGLYDIPLHCTDILEPPAELRKSFDIVLGFFTLHHLFDLEGSFAGMVEFLKPGGKVVFLEPNPLNPLFHLQIWITPRMSYKGERRLLDMRPRTVFRGMQKAGLSQTSMTRFGFFPPFLTNRRLGNRLEAFLERIPIWRSFLPFQLFRGDIA